MITTHKIYFKNANKMDEVESDSVDLMITSPPYPMIEMWDDMFSEQNTNIKDALAKEQGQIAFELIHKELDKVWQEVYRVLKNGGIACVNIGDATRSLNNKFQIYPNHARILNYFLSLGFHALPEILWIKETNKPDKFMGSGMLPVGAYVTLEHEHILILRKNDKRGFKTIYEKLNRQKSAFFWEERNVWFSDKWQDINGVFQDLNNKNLRNRSASFPFELAYRLINMFSVQGDTVIDPFLGTGTTTLASMSSNRNSVGFEIDSNFENIISERINDIVEFSNNYIQKRISNHIEFVKKRVEEKGEMKYFNKFFNFPVITNQEKMLFIPRLKSVAKKDNIFEIEYEENLKN